MKSQVINAEVVDTLTGTIVYRFGFDASVARKAQQTVLAFAWDFASTRVRGSHLHVRIVNA